MIADYIKAENLNQALQALDQNQPIARVLAGGTDIMQKTKAIRRKKNDDIIFVDIKAIEELKGIRQENGYLVIGSSTTLGELMNNELVAAEVPELIAAAGYVGSKELRNRATVGGNICTKNPAADLLIPLLAYDAIIEVCDLNGRREIKLAELIDSRMKGFGRRMLIMAIKIPTGKSLITGYRRWTRESMGRAYLGVMVVFNIDRIKFVIGGASLWPRTLAAGASLSIFTNKEDRTALINQVIQEIMGADDNDSEAYRSQLAKVLLDEALDIAKKGVK